MAAAPARRVPQRCAGPLRVLPYQLPGRGSGASLSTAAAGICKTLSQTPKARPDLVGSCSFPLVSQWVSMELLPIYISEDVSWPQEARDIAGALPADAGSTACYLAKCLKT